MNMNTFDLNLLRVLDALLRERIVSRAAERLALSQPAVSNALNRLRELLDDPFRDALQRIGQSLAGGDTFDPARSRQRVTLALTDYVEALCMPRLLDNLGRAAPGMRLSIQHLTPTLPAEALDKGMVDQWLASQGLKREVAYTTPNYLQAAHLVATTDLLTVLPTRLAVYFAELLPLQVLELPFDVGQFQLELVYLAQRERDTALQWLVERIVEAAPD